MIKLKQSYYLGPSSYFYQLYSKFFNRYFNELDYLTSQLDSPWKIFKGSCDLK